MWSPAAVKDLAPKKTTVKQKPSTLPTDLQVPLQVGEGEGVAVGQVESVMVVGCGDCKGQGAVPAAR
jgi:hypothetical protein